MKLLSWLALGLALLGGSACSRSGSDKTEAVNLKQNVLMEAPPLEAEESAKAVTADAAAVPPPPPAPSTPPAPGSTARFTPPNMAAAPAPVRLLVYHADVKLKTTALPRAMSRLDSLVRRNGGYLSSANETHADGQWQQETTIRVPPARFQALLGGLSGLGSIEEKKLSTDDVTAEHADVAARLQAKRAVEKQYTVLLNKAQRIKDILDIEEKLGEVREEIEATESRLKTLNDEVAYSTITLSMYQPVAQDVPDAPVVSLGSRVVSAFYGGWELLTELFVGAISLWPLLLLAAGGWWLWRRRRARRVVAPIVMPMPPTDPAA
ncbi:MAG: DUF4349 domain-containing protein [Janthinobacterium lividum]